MTDIIWNTEEEANAGGAAILAAVRERLGRRVTNGIATYSYRVEVEAPETDKDAAWVDLVVVSDQCRTLTPEQARRLATYLTEAADAAERGESYFVGVFHGKP